MGETVVVTGRSMLKLRHADQYLIGTFRYTHVYVSNSAAGRCSPRNLRSCLS